MRMEYAKSLHKGDEVKIAKTGEICKLVSDPVIETAGPTGYYHVLLELATSNGIQTFRHPEVK